jgi:hypothetical protein
MVSKMTPRSGAKRKMRPLVVKSIRSGLLLATVCAILAGVGFLPIRDRRVGGFLTLCEEAAAVPALVGTPCIQRGSAVMLGAAVGFAVGFLARYRRRP